MNLQMLKFICLLIILILSIGQPSLAGKLDDFEKEATKESKESQSKEKKPKDKTGSKSNFFSELVSEIIIKGIYYGGLGSWNRTPYADNITELSIRKPGELMIPNVAAEVNYQFVGSNIYALDGRAEVGYGPYGFQFRQTHYSESDPRDILDIIQMHGLIRMSFTDTSGADLGFGVIILDGEERRSGFSFTYPVHLHLIGQFWLKFRPSLSSINGNAIKDYSLGLSYGLRYLSISAGYRWLSSNNSSLIGPYGGLSFYY